MTKSMGKAGAPALWEQVKVLFEDNHLLVLFKPACLPTVPDSSRDPSLLEWGKRYLKETRGKPGNVFLGVVHRLDRPVSGVVCFAKTSKSASRLSSQLRSGAVVKTYIALTAGSPPSDEGFLEHRLRKDRARNRVQVVPEGDNDTGTRLARTAWKVLDRREGLCLLELKPLTGRPHQLRVQCAAMGCPLAGDIKYGAPEPLPDGSIALHALRLELLHPTRQERLVFEAAPPDTGIWRQLAP
jgi:23S rRNA pseudouridine1911/1915/1917 synthase